MIEEFRVHPLYYLLVVLSALLSLLLGRTLWHTATTGTLLFFGVALVALLWFLSALGTRVHLLQTAMTIQRPLRLLLPSPQERACTIDYRQLYSVDQSGRFLQVLTILYYPKEPDGLLDLAQVTTITLPLMGNQQILRQRLEDAIAQ